MSNEILRVTTKNAPAELNFNESIAWATGWNECLEAIAKARAPVPPRLTDSELADLFNGVDFDTMVTADDLFYLIARAVEARVKEKRSPRKGKNDAD